jgi:hypothetical protein
MPNAQCPMPNAQCPMPNAQCPMPNANAEIAAVFEEMADLLKIPGLGPKRVRTLHQERRYKWADVVPIATALLADLKTVPGMHQAVLAGRPRRGVAGATDEDVCSAWGLAFIEPELRESSGEIEAARNRTLPGLVRRDQLLGDLHTHSKHGDGYDSHGARTGCRCAFAAGRANRCTQLHSARLHRAQGAGGGNS